MRAAKQGVGTLRVTATRVGVVSAGVCYSFTCPSYASRWDTLRRLGRAQKTKRKTPSRSLAEKEENGQQNSLCCGVSAPLAVAAAHAVMQCKSEAVRVKRSRPPLTGEGWQKRKTNACRHRSGEARPISVRHPHHQLPPLNGHPSAPTQQPLLYCSSFAASQ